MNKNAPTPAELSRTRRMVALAMRATDDFVLQFVYRDRSGKLTRRVVSPVRFIQATEQEQFSALCLCREEVRQFVLTQCSELVLLHASDVVMPVEIEVIETGVGSNAGANNGTSNQPMAELNVPARDADG